ncbi:MAG: ferredoxin--NADP reductase [Candidatus Zixiibacteriota bacterium]
MLAHKVKLLRRNEIASGTMAFHFDRPEGFEFTAGQCLSMTLIDPPETDDMGNTRVFSIASAPFENEIMIATRMRDTAYKRALKAMTIGAELEVDGPYGDFTLHEDSSRPAVFLTGGIGITPILSILRQAVHDKLRCIFVLFFSNRTLEEAPFFDELAQLTASINNSIFVPIMTKTRSSRRTWTGETGYIDEEMINKYVDNLTVPVYYVVGPPDMVLAVKQTLNRMGIHPDWIRSEEFSGY